MDKRIILQIYKKLLEAKSILLVPHQNPDADALGSVCAFMDFLQSIGKKYQGYCKTEISEKLSFIKHSEKFITTEKEIKVDNYDLIIIFDSGNSEYAGVENILEKSNTFIINIDHHATNTSFGNLNLLNFEAASTTEMLYEFFTELGIKITPAIATALLAGIITDTDRFQNSNTTPWTLEVTGELLSFGGDLIKIQKNLYTNRTINSLKMWGTVLSRLTVREELDFVYTYIKEDDLEKNGVTKEEVENIGNFLNSVKDTKIRLILKEDENGFVKGSLRGSNDPNVDVAIIAQKFGGNGHKKAAGFKTKSTIKEILEKIEKILKKRV
jgi:phosphoesterase RecJ-like protein